VTCSELRCARDLSLRLGATMPETAAHHRQLRDHGDLLARDPQQPYLATFRSWQTTPQQMAEARLTTTFSR
jgi:hypothetical protein